jgi:xylulokinase
MSTQDDQYVLAIDLGTSGPKVALVSSAGEVLSWEFEPCALSLLPSGGAEQDPDEWWAAISKATRRLLGRHVIHASSISAVSCTGQWSGTVAVGQDGKPLMRAIIWMDTRGAPYVRRITGGPLQIQGYAPTKLVRWLRLTGGVPTHAGKDPIAHILFLKAERPEIYKATHKFLEPKDFLNYRLTGRYAASFDSIGLHWLTDNRDIRHVAYDPGLIRLSGIELAKLPDLKQGTDILGPIRADVADELGLKRDIPVVVGSPDLHSAAVGSGAVGDYEAHLYVGTSSWMTCHLPDKKTDLVHNMASLPSGIPGRYLVANEQEAAGASLTFLLDTIIGAPDQSDGSGGRGYSYSDLDRMAERAVPGSHGLIFTPWLFGERTPVEDPTIRGAFVNLSLSTSREDVVRSVFEGVAFNMRWLLTYLEGFVRHRLDPIRIVGGGGQSDVWCQIFADVFDRTIDQVKDPHLANLRGAALLAFMGMGDVGIDDIRRRAAVGNSYTPRDENRKTYDILYQEFLNIYQSHRSICARLNKRDG